MGKITRSIEWYLEKGSDDTPFLLYLALGRKTWLMAQSNPSVPISPRGICLLVGPCGGDFMVRVPLPGGGAFFLFQYFT